MSQLVDAFNNKFKIKSKLNRYYINLIKYILIKLDWSRTKSFTNDYMLKNPQAVTIYRKHKRKKRVTKNNKA